MTNIRYADIQDYLTAIMKIENGDITQSPHGVWWNISYKDFTSPQDPAGQIPNVGIPIMDTQDPLQSSFYVILTDKDGFQGIPQMPFGRVKSGPFITDPGYKTKLANGTEITGTEIIANMKSWLENKFPE